MEELTGETTKERSSYVTDEFMVSQILPESFPATDTTFRCHDRGSDLVGTF